MSSSNSKTIGKGSYGTVTKVENENKVIKKCKIFFYESNDFYLDDHSIREAIFYQLVNKDRIFNKSNPEFDLNIPKVTVSIEHNHSLLFEMDYLGQTLTSYKFFSKDKTIFIFKHILLTLHSLHSHGFSHGDLKPDNILIDTINCMPTIIDYGSICFWHNSNLNSNLYQRCTLYYVSPEELIQNKFSLKNDIWSFGVILFEHLTERCFIRTLIKELGVSQSDQDLFYDYTINLKSDSIFNPILFLSNFFNSIAYKDIFEVICKYIKDRDFQKVIGHCLLKDTTIRCTTQKLLESDIFKCTLKNEAFIKRNIDFLNINSNDIQNYLTPLSDSVRNNIHDLIWNWCNIYPKFNKSLFGHSVMLFDRILLRLNENKVNIPYTILALSSLVLSCMILKGYIIRASSMISLYNESVKVKSSEFNENFDLSIDNIKYYLGLIFSQSQFYLYYKSPDMYLFENNIPFQYNLLRKLFKEYLITSESSIYIAAKYMYQFKE
jgi:serine/threonine protein kinase